MILKQEEPEIDDFESRSKKSMILKQEKPEMDDFERRKKLWF